MTVTIWTVRLSAPMNWSDSWAPKKRGRLGLAGQLRRDRADRVGRAVGDLLEAVEHPEQAEEERGLQQDRQARAERVGPGPLVEVHRLLRHRLTGVGVLLVLVLGLDLLHLGLDELHPPRGVDLLDEQRDHRGPHHHHEADDGQRPRHARVGRDAEDVGEQPVPAVQDPRDDPLERVDQVTETHVVLNLVVHGRGDGSPVVPSAQWVCRVAGRSGARPLGGVGGWCGGLARRVRSGVPAVIASLAGTWSTPPGGPGWHLSNRLSASQVPLTGPNRRMATRA